VLNGNAIEREATRKSRIQDGVRCNGRDNANRQDFSSVMYGEETLKYISSNIGADRSGFLWWSVVECGGVWWSVVECGGVWWSEKE
jgi:hypothetical protein